MSNDDNQGRSEQIYPDGSRLYADADPQRVDLNL